ncbi:DNA-binding protein [Pandoraea eparura]|uniref:DNA-binding protein n=1 Tax=Pandoraea eparura TaxID=2508291 RepID=A0A5E4UYX4_9BURK|nr:DUF296 domain-containing protein [Pandoraea eparura]VVE04319.1 DNA-binding protein [Pandoraea eparura]
MTLPSPRRLTQPGPPAAARIESIAGDALSLTFTLASGENLRDAILGPLEAAGMAAATVRIEGLRLRSMHYVRPAASPDDEHVAFYSEPHRIDEPITIELACATVGRRDGGPFIHCHAMWRTANGHWQGGHIFSDQVIVAHDAVARAWGIANAEMRADFDAETNFTLFRPVPVDAPREPVSTPTGRRCVVARIRPNEDLVQSIEQVCREHGLRAATIRGSVGSIVGARFENAAPVDDIATEIFVLDGVVAEAANGPRATLDIALIDPRGNIHQGRVVRGDNPVLICFELFLEESRDVGTGA